MGTRIRHNVHEIQRSAYYQMPKFLYEGEFKGLSCEARVLYALLRDRHELSVKNGWVDDNEDVYLIYTREEMQSMLGVSENTVTKAVKNLKSFNLIDEERQGMGKPNKIYLLTYAEVESDKKRNFCDSRDANNSPQEPQNLSSNKTYINKTDINKTSSSRETKQTVEQNKESLTADDDVKNVIRLNEKQIEAVQSKLKALDVKLSIQQIQCLVRLSDNDSNKILHLLDVMSTQKYISNAYGWLIYGLKNFDNYKGGQSYKGKLKSRSKLNNYDGREYDYDEIDRLEHEYLIRVANGMSDCKTLQKEPQKRKFVSM